MQTKNVGTCSFVMKAPLIDGHNEQRKFRRIINRSRASLICPPPPRSDLVGEAENGRIAAGVRLNAVVLRCSPEVPVSSCTFVSLRCGRRTSLPHCAGFIALRPANFIATMKLAQFHCAVAVNIRAHTSTRTGRGQKGEFFRAGVPDFQREPARGGQEAAIGRLRLCCCVLQLLKLLRFRLLLLRSFD